MLRSHKLFFPMLLVFFEMATYLSSDMYLPALPTVMKHLHVSHHLVQWTLTTWFMGAISVQLILGPLSDRYGRKPVLCFGSILFVLATLACGLATNVHVLLAARFFQGMGICFMAVPGYASIHELYDQKEAIKLLALMGSISVLAPAFGPILGSVILTVLSWRWIFIFLAAWGAIAAYLLIRYMPESLPADKRHPLHLLTTLQVYTRIITNKRFIKNVVMLGLLFCGFITWIAAGPFVIINQFHQSAMTFSIYQTIIFASYIASNHLVKKWVDRFDVIKLVKIGIIGCFAVSIIFVMTSICFPHAVLGMVIAYVLYSFGSGFGFAPLNRLSIEATEEPMGSRMAMFSMLMSSFATLASVLVGLFYDNTLLSIAAIMGSVMLIAFVMVLRI